MSERNDLLIDRDKMTLVGEVIEIGRFTSNDESEHRVVLKGTIHKLMNLCCDEGTAKWLAKRLFREVVVEVRPHFDRLGRIDDLIVMAAGEREDEE